MDRNLSKIKNRADLETNALRSDLLDLIEAGLAAIDTTRCIEQSVSVEGDTLRIKNYTFSLANKERIFILGFGKVSCQATLALEKILKEKLTGGIALSNVASTCEVVTAYQAHHPRPTQENVSASSKLVELAQKVDDSDLVIVIVSGGGSALLCWPASECEQGNKLYDSFLAAGGTIEELNTIRKHISSLKGGGLAKILYPAEVIGLVFSDIPGGNYENIASGPTYLDHTTIADAQEIINKYELGKYELTETPKDNKWFERVTNIPMASNDEALQAINELATTKGYSSTILVNDLFLSPEAVIEEIFNRAGPNSVIIAGGEARLVIPKNISPGLGGRNTHISLLALRSVASSQCFASVASDGIDNSLAAGAIADESSKQHFTEQGIDIRTTITRFDSYEAFKETGDLIQTGPTESNVSDIYILITDHKSDSSNLVQ